MKVVLQVHGGFAGGLRRAPLVVDAEKLDPADATQLRSLVEQAKGQAASAPRPARGADVQAFVMRIEDAGGSAELRASDLDQPEAFRALRRFVEAKGE